MVSVTKLGQASAARPAPDGRGRTKTDNNRGQTTFLLALGGLDISEVYRRATSRA